jgi:glycine/D-amino acid oxidase-like deaminating enzyme
MKMLTNAVVIGGGVIGTSITYCLSRAGVKVTLVERSTLASEASGANQGGWSAQLMRGRTMNFARDGSKTYEALSDEIQYDFEFDRVGTYMLLNDESQWSEVEENAKRLRREYQMNPILLSGNELRETDPDLALDIPGACFCPSAYLLNPMKLVFGLALASQRLGAEIQTFTEAKKISVNNGKIDSVMTSRGEIPAQVVVIAAGAWASQIAATLRIRVPIKPRRGQLLVSESWPLRKTRYIIEAEQLHGLTPAEIRDAKDPRAKHGIVTVLSQPRSGNWLIGSSRDFPGYDKRTTIETTALIAKRAQRYFPKLRYANIIRTFAGLRPFSDDGHPIVDMVNEIEGLILATGHYGEGVSLAPVTAKVVTDLVTKGRGAEIIEEFSYNRFKDQALLEGH